MDYISWHLSPKLFEGNFRPQS